MPPDTRTNDATPRPWKTDLMYVVGPVEGGRPGGEVIAECGPTVASLRGRLPNTANAALIVRAVNAHDAAMKLADLVDSMRCPIPEVCGDTWCSLAREVLAEFKKAMEEPKE